MAKKKPIPDDALARQRVNEFAPYGIERVGGFEYARRPPGQEGRPRRTVEELLALFAKVKLDIDVDELRGRTAASRDRRR